MLPFGPRLVDVSRGAGATPACREAGYHPNPPTVFQVASDVENNDH